MLAGSRVEKDIENAEVISLQTGVQKAIAGIGCDCRRPSIYPGSGERIDIAGQQAHGVARREAAGSFVPSRDKLRRLIGGAQARLKLVRGVVIEAEIGSGKPFGKNCHAGKQAHRFAFYLIGRGEQDFAVALEKSPCDFPQHVASEGNGAILERDVD